MPLDIFVTPGEFLSLEESDGISAIASSRARLTESGWREASAALQRCVGLTGVLMLQENNLHSQLVCETWAALPTRLASLAIRPTPATVFVTRSEDITREVLHSATDRGTYAPLWRFLVEFSKGQVSIESRAAECHQRFVEMTDPPRDDDKDWLPGLLSSPTRHDLEWVFRELKLIRPSDLCGKGVSLPDSPAVFAGLWLLHGDATESHRYSQSIEDEGRHRCGNFWHAIMHRQEPDYGNSKYWFRRVGQHPIFPELARRADELIVADGSDAVRRWRGELGLPSGCDPLAFVDWCEAATREADARQINLIRRIQFVEMHLLLRESFADATRST